MSSQEILLKIYAKLSSATLEQLEKIDGILDGREEPEAPADLDIRTCTVIDAAKKLGVSRTAVYRLIGKGEIDQVNFGGKISRIRVSSLIDFVTKKGEEK